MIVVTSKFIELLNANSRTFRMKLVNGSDEYTNILSLKWSASLPSYLSIGNALCTCVECKAVGIPISIKGTYLDVYITVIGSNEWVQIGTFKAEKPTLQNGVVSFSAYDVMNECSKAIFAHKLGTVTIGECFEIVISDIEREIGTVSYVPLSSSIASLKINADLLIGYDCRNVLAYIAGYLGCNCVVNNIGSIEMRGFTVCAYILDDNRIAEPELDDDISDLEFLACSVNGDTKLLYGNNGEGFEFICPIMTQERLDEIGATLCASTSAVNVYRSGKIKHILGDFRLQIGDIVSLEHDGEIHIIPISSIVFEFDGGLSADIEALPLAEASALSLADTLDFISKQNANKRITGITNYYLATSQVNNVTKYTTGWSDTVQAVSADKKYLWNYEVVTLADGTSYETEPCIIGNFAENGSNGRGIKSIIEYYLITQTESTPSKTSFKPNVQTPTETHPFLWNYEKIEYTDDSTPYESDVRLIGVYGSDGKSFYTWVRYADDANGTNMSDSPSGRKYIGIATNKSTETESDKASDYKWSLIQGNDGRGVNKVETEYYLSTSDQYLSGGSWSTSAPTWVDGRYLWTRLVTYYTDGTSEESDPVVDASWKKTTAVESASKELNETLANALGLCVTELNGVRYYHSNPTLASSKQGDTILVLNARGFGVCKTGWNGGNPQFTYGATFDGKAVWDILTANKINADLIETGKIKSTSNAKVQSHWNLDNGEMTFENNGVKLTIHGALEEDGVEITTPGVSIYNGAVGEWLHMVSGGLAFRTDEFETELLNWLLGELIKATLNPDYEIDFSKQPSYHMSVLSINEFQTRKICCESFYLFDGDSGNSATHINLRGMLESISALQARIGELETALDQQHTHANASAVRENVVEATCESGGSYDSVVYCATCGEEISRTPVTTTKLGHDWHSVVVPPTTTEQGYTEHSCSRCGYSYQDNFKAPVAATSATVQIVPEDAGVGDTVYLTSTPNGSSLGTSKEFTENQFCYFHAEAGTGRKIVGFDFNGTYYTAEEIYETYASESPDVINATHTVLNFPCWVAKIYLGTVVTGTVYFDEASSGSTEVGSNEVRIIASVGGGSGAAGFAKASGEILEVTEMVLPLDSTDNYYVFGMSDEGWVISYAEIYKNGTYYATIPSSAMGDELLYEGRVHMFHPALNGNGGSTLEVKYYFV